MIELAASAAFLGFAGERQDDGPACGRRGTGRSPANPREAALAADLITASSIRLLAVPGQYGQQVAHQKETAALLCGKMGTAS